jgi:hypothetical protein
MFDVSRHDHQITVCWDITPYTLVYRYQSFGRTCFLCLQDMYITLKIEIASFSEALVPTYQSKQRHIEQVRSSDNVSNLYAGCNLFDSRTGHMLTGIFHDFTQILQANTISVPEIGPWQFPSTPFQFIIH